jgi:hypothetical protein
MAVATKNGNREWRAEVRWERRCYTTIEQETPAEIGEATDPETADAPDVHLVEVLRTFSDLFVDLDRPGSPRISFRVNYRAGRGVTFTDPRARDAGTAGVTGIWGTLPAPRLDKPRPLSPTAFRIEVGRLIGAERAEQIVQEAQSEIFLKQSMTDVRERAPRLRVGRH